ncbi:MAG: HEAT repeat domain-containing protein [Chloroflexota bacterium]
MTTPIPDGIREALADVNAPQRRYNAFVQLTNVDPVDEAAVVALLVPYLDDDDWGIREGAAWSAGQMRLAAMAPHIEAVITREGEDEQVRYMAALALCYINGDSPEALLALRNHPDDAVQRVAQAALYAVPYIS